MTESVQKLMRVRRRARTAFYIVTALGAAGLALASSTGLLRHDPEMQPLLFCASVSWSLVAGVRLAEGRIALNSRRTTYSGAQSVVGLWALVFALVAGMMTAEKIVMLLPNPLWQSDTARPATTIEVNLK